MWLVDDGSVCPAVVCHIYYPRQALPRRKRGVRPDTALVVLLQSHSLHTGLHMEHCHAHWPGEDINAF